VDCLVHLYRSRECCRFPAQIFFINNIILAHDEGRDNRMPVHRRN